MGRERLPFGRRGVVLAAIALLGVWALLELGRGGGDLLPSAEDFLQIRRFLGAALRPAFDYDEGQEYVGDVPFLAELGASLRTTVVVATAAVSLSLVIGVCFGFLGSSAWWTADPAGGGATGPLLRAGRAVAPVVYGVTRVVIAGLRSVHELLWATLLLAAFGLNAFSAVLAIAIPYGGTLAKIFSEMIDEAPRDAADALRESGARPAAVFAFGLLPRALPDMSSYALYRFECALRAAAVLGFFGVPTVGYHIRHMFGMGRHEQVWTYLYALMLLVLVLDWWSGAIRRRFLR